MENLVIEKEEKQNQKAYRKLPPALLERIQKIESRKKRIEDGELECSSYHDWDNGGYSIYSDRG